MTTKELALPTGMFEEKGLPANVGGEDEFNVDSVHGLVMA
jgi:hypothetical protein